MNTIQTHQTLAVASLEHGLKHIFWLEEARQHDIEPQLLHRYEKAISTSIRERARLLEYLETNKKNL